MVTLFLSKSVGVSRQKAMRAPELVVMSRPDVTLSWQLTRFPAQGVLHVDPCTYCTVMKEHNSNMREFDIQYYELLASHVVMLDVNMLLRPLMKTESRIAIAQISA